MHSIGSGDILEIIYDYLQISFSVNSELRRTRIGDRRCASCRHRRYCLRERPLGSAGDDFYTECLFAVYPMGQGQVSYGAYRRGGIVCAGIGDEEYRHNSVAGCRNLSPMVSTGGRSEVEKGGGRGIRFGRSGCVLCFFTEINYGSGACGIARATDR